MAEFDKESRYSVEEALEDIANLDRASLLAGMESAQDLNSISDVKALEDLLREHGGYEPIRHTDTIQVGHDSLRKIKSSEIEKGAFEIEKIEEAIRSVQTQFLERFGLECEDFPVERVVYLSERDFDKRFPDISQQFGEDIASSVSGKYLSGERIIVVKYKPQESSSQRVKKTIHEYIHDVLITQHGSERVPESLRQILSEGVTEQLTIEMGTDVLFSDDLADGTMDMYKNVPGIGGMSGEDFKKFLPTFANITAGENMDELTAIHAAHSYGLERHLLYVLYQQVQELGEKDGISPSIRAKMQSDTLAFFVGYLTGKDIGAMDKLFEKKFGKDKWGEIRENKHLRIRDLL